MKVTMRFYFMLGLLWNYCRV